MCARFTLTLSSIARAHVARTWLTGIGDEANPCRCSAPCKTFAGAISRTATGGEINNNRVFRNTDGGTAPTIVLPQ